MQPQEGGDVAFLANALQRLSPADLAKLLSNVPAHQSAPSHAPVPLVDIHNDPEQPSATERRILDLLNKQTELLDRTAEETRGLRDENKALREDVQQLQRKRQNGDGDDDADNEADKDPTEAPTRRKRAKKAAVAAQKHWYQVPESQPEKDLLDNLREAVKDEFRAKIFVYDSDGDSDGDPKESISDLRARVARHEAWRQLPKPGETRTHPSGRESQAVDFSSTPAKGINKTLRGVVMRSVMDSLKELELTADAVPGCPVVTAKAVEEVFRTTFFNLKADYGVQNDPEKRQKKDVKDHQGRVSSTQYSKLLRRRKAVKHFKIAHSDDPTPLLHIEWMSGDESAGDDTALANQYWDAVDTPSDRRTADNRVLATQILSWRAEWVKHIYLELDRLSVQHRKRASRRRIQRVIGGPIITTFPRTFPRPCMVQPAFYLNGDLPADFAGRVDPDGWGPFGVEHERWVPQEPTI